MAETSLINSLSNSIVQYKEEIAVGAIAILATTWFWNRKRETSKDRLEKKERKLLRRKSKLLSDYRNDKDYIKIPHEVLNAENTLLQEVKFMGSPTCGIERVPHLINELRVFNIQQIPNPIHINNKVRNKYGGTGFLPNDLFTYQGSYVIGTAAFSTTDELKQQKQWLASGPRKHLFFEPTKVKAAIVTCGGLCPGLNVVIRELFLGLTINYAAAEVWAVKYGYEGFYKYDWELLTIDTVRTIHMEGGTNIGSSRGGFELEKIVDEIQKKGINQVYILGGDGTHKGIYKIYKECSKRNLEISCVGVPKTIDNDIPIIDKSFGFETAVAQSIRAIKSAYVESRGADYGIGLVRLMGRDAGWIAMEATNASRDVNVCLVPEFKFDLYGQDGLLQYIAQQLAKERHLVIVVAQGAGEAVRDHKIEDTGVVDKTGNKKAPDIGNFLKDNIVKYCKEKKIEVTLKYIDPTYMIRTVPAIPHDRKLCTELAWSAVNGAMAGFTGFTVGHVNNSVCMIPLEAIENAGKNRLVPNYRGWQRLLASTGQPSFLNELPPAPPS